MPSERRKRTIDREKVIRTARELFYLNGYKDTFLSHIAEKCGTSKQLLSYYFPSKADLANEVIGQIYAEIRENVQQKMRYYFNGLDDLQVSTAVEIKLYGRMRLHDENAIRFFAETMGVIHFDNMDPDADFSLYKQHDQRYHLQIDHSRDELKMLARVGELAGATLYYDFSKGIYNCSEQQLEDYGVEILYRLMNIPESRIREINEMSNAILDLCNFSFLPYFTIV